MKPPQYTIYEELPPTNSSITAETAVNCWVTGKTDSSFDTFISQRGLRLDDYKNNQKKTKPPIKPKRLSRTQLKSRGLLDIANDNISFNDALMLNELWKQYILRVLQPGARQSSCAILAVSDLHGAYLQVVKCRNPAAVNIEGVVVQETEQTFKLVSADNKLRSIIKEASIFHLELNGFRYVLYGQHLCHRGPFRSKMKLKSKNTVCIK